MGGLGLGRPYGCLNMQITCLLGAILILTLTILWGASVLVRDLVSSGRPGSIWKEYRLVPARLDMVKGCALDR